MSDTGIVSMGMMTALQFCRKRRITIAHQEVVIVTERAVFKLTQKGLMLTEIAPGIDLQKDILEQMEFSPLIAKDLKLMDSELFYDARLKK